MRFGNRIIILATALASCGAGTPLLAQRVDTAAHAAASPPAPYAATPAFAPDRPGLPLRRLGFPPALSGSHDSAALPAPLPSPWRLASDTTDTPLDLRIARIARSHALRENILLRASSAVTGLAAFPGTLLLAGALYGAGEARDDEDLSELGLRLGTASTASIGATVGVKLLVGRARPDISPEAPGDVKLGRGFRGNDYQSFPSAHTAAAFATATVLTAELGMEGAARFWLPPTAYGVATLAGLSRIYHDEHWFTDILAGAVIGLASGVFTTQLIDN